MVAEVDVGLPRGERLLAHLGEAEHHLQAGPDALLEGGERELAGVADEDHAAGDPDDVLGLLALLEVPPLLAHLRQRVGAGDRDRVRRDAGREQAVALVAADPQLLGEVGLGEGGGRLGHEGQAYGGSTFEPSAARGLAQAEVGLLMPHRWPNGSTNHALRLPYPS